jgi:uncharacterized protein
MKQILLVTDGLFHPPYFARLELHKCLAELDGFSFNHIPSMEKLPPDLEQFAAFVIYFHAKTISEAALGAMETYVSKGGGILAIHSATASFKQSKQYSKILGGRFVGHGAIGAIEIKSTKREIFGEVKDFSIRDELYLHDIQPGVDIHFTARLADRVVPVVWTYHYGKGKVCYAVPGHTTASMRNPFYQKILQRGLGWVTE